MRSHDGTGETTQYRCNCNATGGDIIISDITVDSRVVVTCFLMVPVSRHQATKQQRTTTSRQVEETMGTTITTDAQLTVCNSKATEDRQIDVIKF